MKVPMIEMPEPGSPPAPTRLVGSYVDGEARAIVVSQLPSGQRAETGPLPLAEAERARRDVARRNAFHLN